MTNDNTDPETDVFLPFVSDLAVDEGLAVFPSACVDGKAGPPLETAAAVRSPAYPVPNRSPEMNRRIAGHEIGHVFCMRALSDAPISYVSITRGDGFEGRACGANYKPSQHHLEDQTDETVDICARIEKLTPGLGSSRVESAEFHIRAQTLVIELVAGSVAELILFPDEAPLRAEHDRIEARAVAALACASPLSVDAMLTYAKSEAGNLIRENLNIILALVDALVDSRDGKLTGEQVDAVIGSAMARDALISEVNRRSDWQSVELNAADFAAREE